MRNSFKIKKQKGAAIILFVALMTVLAVLFFASSRSFSMFALRRSLAVGDTVRAIYDAESRVNDIFARFLGGYDLSALRDEIIIPADVAGGTEIVINLVRDNGKVKEVVAKAGRTHATSQLRGIREDEELVGGVDIVLILDCTSSMNNKADDDCEGEECKTRMESQKEAALGFVDGIMSQAENIREQFNVGIAVFGIESVWLTHNSVDVKPGAFDHNGVKDAIENSFGKTRKESSACEVWEGETKIKNVVLDATSIGSGFALSNDYFESQIDDGSERKPIEILISDGVPNSRIPHDDCSDGEFCTPFWAFCNKPPYGWSCYKYPQEYQDENEVYNEDIARAFCYPYARDFMQCTLATTDDENNPGIRNPLVDAYTVTVYSHTEQEISDILDTHSTKYFNTSNAEDLPEILDDILEEIVTKYSKVNIKREIPF